MLLANKTKSLLKDLLYLAITLGLFYALWLGSHPLFSPDEGRYSEVAREMVVSGDFITPRLNGVPFLDKPVLYYWLQASAIELFGLKEWALRLWPALIGLLGSLVTFYAGYTLFNRRTGFFAAIILATSPLYYGAAHYANLDLEVSVLIGNALLFFLIGISASQKKDSTRFLLLAYVFAALAFLTKGMIGLALPTLVIGCWILLLNRWSTLLHMRLISGLILFLALTLPWYLLVQKANPEFLHFFFITQQITRFLTKAAFNNQTSGWFYFPIVLLGFFPWSLGLIQSLVKSLKKVWQHRHANQTSVFLLTWIVLIFTFFSIPKSKTLGYILPIFPALSLLVAHYVDQLTYASLEMKIMTRSFSVVCTLVSIACLIILYVHPIAFNPNLKPFILATASIFLLGGLIMEIPFIHQHIVRFFSCMTATIVFFLLTLSLSTPYLSDKSVKPLALNIKQNLRPNDEIVTFYKYYQDLPMYIERRITIVADWDSPTIPENDNWLRELWYGMPYVDTHNWLITENRFWNKWHSAKHLYVLMDKSYLNQFKSQGGNNFYIVGAYNNVIAVRNFSAI